MKKKGGKRGEGRGDEEVQWRKEENGVEEAQGRERKTSTRLRGGVEAHGREDEEDGRDSRWIDDGGKDRSDLMPLEWEFRTQMRKEKEGEVRKGWHGKRASAVAVSSGCPSALSGIQHRLPFRLRQSSLGECAAPDSGRSCPSLRLGQEDRTGPDLVGMDSVDGKYSRSLTDPPGRPSLPGRPASPGGPGGPSNDCPSGPGCPLGLNSTINSGE